MPILTFDEVHSTLVNETLMAILSDMHDTFLNLGQISFHLCGHPNAVWSYNLSKAPSHDYHGPLGMNFLPSFSSQCLVFYFLFNRHITLSASRITLSSYKNICYSLLHYHKSVPGLDETLGSLSMYLHQIAAQRYSCTPTPNTTLDPIYTQLYCYLDFWCKQTIFTSIVTSCIHHLLGRENYCFIF